jgi:anti-sigma regulatory factor (Ser/Thr protein kinase)
VIGDYLRRHADDVDAANAGELVVSELVTNGLRHSRGPVWVSVDWSAAEPVVTVHDLGPEFDLEATLPERNAAAENGRGLFIVASLVEQLRVAAKRAGGKSVSARLDVRRREEHDYDWPEPAFALPPVSEARPGGGFDRETFLRALVVQLAEAMDLQHGPAAAEAAVARVGSAVGGRMEEEYRLAREVVGRLTSEQVADCYVRLKAAIGGDFYVIEISDERIVLGNRRCPFGEVVKHAPSLCRMTSSVFGGIAARNAGEASVILEERIAVGDPECRVVVHLGPLAADRAAAAHRYRRTPSLSAG